MKHLKLINELNQELSPVFESKDKPKIIVTYWTEFGSRKEKVKLKELLRMIKKFKVTDLEWDN